jgi:hypothetical protein
MIDASKEATSGAALAAALGGNTPQSRRYRCDFAVGDHVETDNRTGVIIGEVDVDPPASERPFLVRFGAVVYGMSKGGTLYDTISGRNLGTVARKLRAYHDFYVVLGDDKHVVASLAAPVTGLPTAHLRWYEDGEVVQIEGGK